MVNGRKMSCSVTPEQDQRPGGEDSELSRARPIDGRLALGIAPRIAEELGVVQRIEVAALAEDPVSAGATGLDRCRVYGHLSSSPGMSRTTFYTDCQEQPSTANRGCPGSPNSWIGLLVSPLHHNYRRSRFPAHSREGKLCSPHRGRSCIILGPQHPLYSTTS
jgi:hypothetical protein